MTTTPVASAARWSLRSFLSTVSRRGGGGAPVADVFSSFSTAAVASAAASSSPSLSPSPAFGASRRRLLDAASSAGGILDSLNGVVRTGGSCAPQQRRSVSTRAGGDGEGSHRVLGPGDDGPPGKGRHLHLGPQRWEKKKGGPGEKHQHRIPQAVHQRIPQTVRTNTSLMEFETPEEVLDVVERSRLDPSIKLSAVNVSTAFNQLGRMAEDNQWPDASPRNLAADEAFQELSRRALDFARKGRYTSLCISNTIHAVAKLHVAFAHGRGRKGHGWLGLST